MQSVSTLLWAYGQLCHFDEELFEALAARCQDLLPPRGFSARGGAAGAPAPPPSAAGTPQQTAVAAAADAPEVEEEGIGPRAQVEAPNPPAPHLSPWDPRSFAMVTMAYARNYCMHAPACRQLLASLADEALLQIDAFDCQARAGSFPTQLRDVLSKVRDASSVGGMGSSPKHS